MYLRKVAVVIVLAVLLGGGLMPKTSYAQGLSEERIAFIEKYSNIAIRNGAKYDIPWETAMAIAIFESGQGTSYSAIKRHNFHGLSGGKFGNQNFATDEEGWEAFYQNLFEQKCYTSSNALLYRDNPQKFFEAIVVAGYNPDPDYYIAKVGPFVRAVEDYRDEHNLPSSRGYIALFTAVTAE